MGVEKFNRSEPAQKFIQVGVDIECMRNDFGGRGLSGFGDKISLWSIIVEKFN